VRTTLYTALLLVVVLVACAKEPIVDEADVVPPEADAVVFDPATVPYPTLSTYRFFKGAMRQQVPVASVLPYAPITPLFSDYSHKLRFVWMPPGVRASYNGDENVLDFPDGAVLIKTFYYDGVQPGNTRRLIETRLLFKRNGEWEFADYVWNAEQTEAHLDLNGSNTPVTWTDEQGVTRTISYRIPSAAECQTCHKIAEASMPIGPKPQNLNSLHPYAGGVQNQLKKWVEQGFLAPGYPKNINTVVDWSDVTQPMEERVRAYLDMNCAHCHTDLKHCSYRPLRLAWHENADPVNQGACIPPDDPIEPSMTYIVSRGNAARSMLHYRLSSNDEAVRMPLLGRTIVHQEAVDMIATWINSMPEPCN
jgi:uncharacterized repeat protein (TIGR03806 family)